MPFDRSKYPKNWEAISLRIRRRARGRCECRGECGIDHSRQGSMNTVGAGADEFRERYGGRPFVNQIIGEVRCAELNGRKAMFARGKIVLTVAHKDHIPENCWSENLRAWCQRCHLRYDRFHHQKNAAETRRKKKESAAHDHPRLPMEGT
jgi:hypothetical protein